LEVFEDEVFEKRRETTEEREEKFLNIFHSSLRFDRFEDLKSD
tara:strand:- start:1620 stop:1748 length:129 start_codon:yes stop_codon:yes gene_type:complete